MGSSLGSQFFNEYPEGIRCRLASASVARGFVLEADLAHEFAERAVCGRFGTEVEVRLVRTLCSGSYVGEYTVAYWPSLVYRGENEGSRGLW
jgi:hypothetical protein